MYDVAIVGARCAGSALALMLARSGARVLLVDRATFPSDTMSGHFIQPAGVSCLRRLGLYEDLVALGYPAQETMTVDFGEAILSGTPAPMPDGTTQGFAPRRFRFDSMLAEAAVQAGAELREGTSFVEPLVEAGRVVGLKASAQSRETNVLARMVVGADGKRSRVARMVGSEQYDAYPAQCCAYYNYWEGTDVSSTRLFVRDGLFAVTVPCGDGSAFLAVQWPNSRFAEVRMDIDAATRQAIGSIDWLAEHFSGARPVQRYVGTGDLDAFFRTASGPGWALVGDAGNHKDPISAQGMTDALLDAELLAEALIDGLDGQRDLDGALTDFGRARDRRSMPMHRVTVDLARLVLPPPEALAGMAAMSADSFATGRFLGVMAGSVPAEEIFGPPTQQMAVA